MHAFYVFPFVVWYIHSTGESILKYGCWRGFESVMLRFEGTSGCLFPRDPNMEADVGFPPSRDDFSARDEEDYEEDDKQQPWFDISRGINRYILAGT